SGGFADDAAGSRVRAVDCHCDLQQRVGPAGIAGFFAGQTRGGQAIRNNRDRCRTIPIPNGRFSSIFTVLIISETALAAFNSWPRRATVHRDQPAKEAVGSASPALPGYRENART